MKRAKKIIAVFLGVLLLISCLTATAFAAETNTQDGLTAVIQTDKENYSVNEEIHITVTVTNNNSFEVKNVSIESFLPDTLTLKDGDLKSKTVNLQSGETLTLACVAILEKEEQSSSENETSESTTEETTTEITETTETATETTEPITDETSTTPDTTTSETEPDDILPIEPSTNESNHDATTESASQENNPTSLDTGDNSSFVKILIALIIAMAIIAAYIIITKKNNKKATKVISLVLCGAIAISSVATIGFIKVGAEESNTQNFTVDKTITVDGESYTISANVSYDKSETEKTEFTETELDEMEKVETKISELLNSTNYQTEDEDDRKKAVQELLQEVANNNLIIPNSVMYNEEYKQFYFLYNSGIEHYINIEKEIDRKLLPRDNQDDMETLQNEYKEFFKSVSKNSRIDIDYNRNNCIFTYGAEGTYDPTSNVDIFNRLGLKTYYRTYPTVEDYKSILSGYDMIIICEHGADFFNKNKLGLSLSEEVTRDKNKKYEHDLKEDRITKYNNTYCILPSFFEYYYNGKLNNAFVQLIACQSFGRKGKLNYNFNESFTSCGAIGTLGFHNSILGEYGHEFSKYFTFAMFANENTKEAFDYACEKVGENEYEFISRNLDRCSEELIKEKEKEKEKGIIAYPDITDHYSNPFDYGTFSMTIKDKEEDIPISEASATIYWIGDDTELYEDNPNQHFEYNLSTNTNGILSKTLPIGYYKCEITKDGYQSKLLAFEITKDFHTTIVEPIYLTPKNGKPEFAGGDGTIENPYQVSTPEQLNAVRNDLDAHYIQINDIDMSGWENWEPIGNAISIWGGAIGGQNYKPPVYTDNYFTGVYDGNQYSISNLTLKDNKVSVTEDCFGLFAGLENATIKNLTLNNISYNIDKASTDYTSYWANQECTFSLSVGGIAGRCTSSTISNCSVTGKISVTNCSNAYAGGIAGIGDTILQCSSDVEIYVNATKDSRFEKDAEVYCGGIVGEPRAVNRRISNCNNRGNINVIAGAGARCGGISGENGYITHCLNYGNIVGNVINQSSYSSFAGTSNVGGIVGATSSDNISYCVNYGNISSCAKTNNASTTYLTSYAGGIAGYCGYYGSGNINNCYNFNNSISSYKRDKDDNFMSGTLGRIAGYSIRINSCYSVNTTTLNGTIPTEYTQADQTNGFSLTKKEIEEKIAQIDFDSIPKA